MENRKMNNEIKIRSSRTLNLGNYESASISIEFGRELQDNEDPEKQIKLECDFVTNLVEDEALKIREDYNAK